jgi:hypothetical protein
MAEILVSDLRELSPALIGGLFSLGRDRPHPTPPEDLNRAEPDANTRRISVCFHCSAPCFFHCFPLLLRRRLFCRPAKALHCIWRAFSIVDRLYFFPPQIARVLPIGEVSVGHEGARGRQFRVHDWGAVHLAEVFIRLSESGGLR